MKRSLDTAFNYIIQAFVKRFKTETGDAYDPMVVEHMNAVTRGANNDANNDDDDDDDDDDTTLPVFDSIPREMVGEILGMIHDVGTYPSVIALYGALARTSRLFASMLETPFIWRPLFTAYVRRSMPTHGVDEEDRAAIRADINKYIQTIYDHHCDAVTARSSRPELTEEWRTWKRLLEHFRRRDTRIKKGGPMLHIINRDEDTGNASGFPFYRLRYDSFIPKTSIVDCAESPFSFVIDDAGYIHAMSGYGGKTHWHQRSRVRIAGTTLQTALVAFPKTTERGAYFNLITQTRVNGAHHVSVHRIETRGKAANGTDLAPLVFHINALVLESPHGNGWPACYIAATRDFVCFSTVEQSADPHWFIAQYDWKTGVYLFRQTIRRRDNTFHRKALVPHDFRPNIFVAIYSNTVHICELDRQSGALRRALVVKPNVDFLNNNPRSYLLTIGVDNGKLILSTHNDTPNKTGLALTIMLPLDIILGNEIRDHVDLGHYCRYFADSDWKGEGRKSYRLKTYLASNWIVYFFRGKAQFDKDAKSYLMFCAIDTLNWQSSASYAFEAATRDVNPAVFTLEFTPHIARKDMILHFPRFLTGGNLLLASGKSKEWFSLFGDEWAFGDDETRADNKLSSSPMGGGGGGGGSSGGQNTGITPYGSHMVIAWWYDK